MPDESNPKAPYLPFTTFKKFIAGINAAAIPSRIDKTLMPGMSGSMQSWILSAMKFFELSDQASAPTPKLASLVTGEADARKAAWKEIFIAAYQPIIAGLDLERATLGQLNERFAKDYSGDTARKCQSFFSAAAEDAGVVLSEHLKPKGRGTGTRKPRKARVSPPVPPASEEMPAQTGGGNGLLPGAAVLWLDKDGTRSVKLLAPATVTDSELDRIQKWLSFQLIVERSAK